jgi:hypothetical protein
MTLTLTYAGGIFNQAGADFYPPVDGPMPFTIGNVYVTIDYNGPSNSSYSLSSGGITLSSDELGVAQLDSTIQVSNGTITGFVLQLSLTQEISSDNSQSEDEYQTDDIFINAGSTGQQGREFSGLTASTYNTVTGTNTEIQNTYSIISWGDYFGPGGPLISMPITVSINGTVAGQTVTDPATIDPFSNVVVADTDISQTETVTVTLSATANGTLSNLGGGSYDSTTGVYTDTGSASQVTAALDELVFTPTADQVAPGQTVTTTFTITDTDTAGATATDSTTSVIATAGTVMPTVTGTVADQTVTSPATVDPFSDVAITDLNVGQTETVTVALSSTANGTLSGGFSYSAATGAYTDIGSAAQVTAALDGLVFTPTGDQVAPGQTIATTFTITDTDTAGATATDSTTSVIATEPVLFTTGADTVDFNNLTANQQAAIAVGANIYLGLGGSDVVTLPDEVNYNESVGNGHTLGWTDTPASTFYTGSQFGDTYTVNGDDGNYNIVEGAGTEFITINGDGDSTITAGSGTDNISFNGDGNNTIDAGTGTESIVLASDGNNIVNGNAFASGLSLGTDGNLAVTGDLHVIGGITGIGAVLIDNNATLELGNSFDPGGTVTFVGSGTGSLILDSSSDFQGKIIGFSNGDTIDLEGVIANEGTYDANTGLLTLYDSSYGSGTAPIDEGAISFPGLSASQTFSLSYYGTAGTEITYGEPAPSIATLALLSQATYDNATSSGNYQEVDFSSDPNVGFLGVAFDYGNQVVVAFRGTYWGNLGDGANNVIADASFWGTATTPDSTFAQEVQDAANFLQKVRQDVSLGSTSGPYAQITITGHSLGGALAQVLGYVSGYTTIAFDAPGAGLLLYPLAPYDGAASMAGDGVRRGNTNYHMWGDQVSLAGGSIGTQLTVLGTEYPDDVPDIINNHNLLYLESDIANGTATVSGTPYPNLLGSIQCYRQGTRVLTPLGEVAVEHLRVGDSVQTMLSEAATPIIWLGHRRIDCMRHFNPKLVWPVRIAVGAFGLNQPHTDLFLSPDHAVFVDGVMIPIKHLINSTTIAQVPMDEVTYYHIELDDHEVLLAEGLPVESYLDTGDRRKFTNGSDPISLFPDFSSQPPDAIARWEAFGCASLIVTGSELDAVRRRVNERAAARDLRNSSAPDLRYRKVQ